MPAKKSKLVKGRDIDEALMHDIETLLPFLKALSIVPSSADVMQVRDADLKELADRWNMPVEDLKTKRVLTFAELIKALSFLASRIAQKRADERQSLRKKRVELKWDDESPDGSPIAAEEPPSSMFDDEDEIDPMRALETDTRGIEFSHISVKFKKNYFGLPNHALNRTAAGVIYQGRAAKKGQKKDEEEIDFEQSSPHAGKNGTTYDDLQDSVIKEEKKTRPSSKSASRKDFKENISQKKVSYALLKMASNPSMLHHFVFKGGVEAVYKLSNDTSDPEVLQTCASCLATACMEIKFCGVLLDKEILPNLLNMAENGDEAVRYQCGRTLSILSAHPGIPDIMIKRGILICIQSLLTSQRDDVLCYACLCASNIAACYFSTTVSSASEAEQVVRFCIGISRKLDLMHSYDASFFISTVLANLSRIPQYTALLVEEGGLSVVLAMLAHRSEPSVTDSCTETFVNLSLNRKNQREIASSGISLHFSKILGGEGVSPQSRAFCLMMIGNLLSAGYLQDKIARPETISTIIAMLDPKTSPRQFCAVAYCITQISQLGQASDILVSCGVLSAMSQYLDVVSEQQAYFKANVFASESAEAESAALFVLRDGMSYIWTILSNLINSPKHYSMIAKDTNILSQVYRESQKPISSPTTEISTSFTNTVQSEIMPFMLNFTSVEGLENLCQIDSLIQVSEAARTIFEKAVDSSSPLAIKLDVMSILVNLARQLKFVRKVILGENLIAIIEKAGNSDKQLNQKFIALISLLSTDENCCVKLIDQGAQKIIVSLQDANNELMKELTAAAFHNLSIKRATLGPGQLTTLLELAKGSKTYRVLWVVRTFANLSAKNKPRTSLAKERRVISTLTMLMRGGGVPEADRVQRYCAYSICNILSSHVDKAIIDELIKNNTLSDIVVITLLRVNSGVTKEALSRVIFNFLTRADFRQRMVGQGQKGDLDLLGAILELGRIELLDLLELSIRVMYNFSCEISTAVYANRFEALKIPQLLIGRIIVSPNIPGARATNSAKQMCAMSLANVSFDKTLARFITLDKSFPDAAHSIHKLKSEDATYCICTTILNLSYLEECITLSDTEAVTVLVETLPKGYGNSTQIAVAALCNLSTKGAFYGQLTSVGMKDMMVIMASPQLAMPIKLDSLHFLYNLVTSHPQARAAAIEADCVPALWKLIKALDDIQELCVIARITMEICYEAVQYVGKLLHDGVMPILLKLSKLEVPTIKYDISRAIYSLTTVSGPETMKILKWDTADILFWLTLHDCLDLYDPIKRHCVRALRNFTLKKEEALILCNEDRLTTIIKALAKSTDLDILRQTAAVLYNLMSVEETKAIILKRGAIALIFEVAACGYDNVRFICSACLHMAPDHMPDMEDPAVLSLVMCLLDADGDMFGELGVRSVDYLEYVLGSTSIPSAFEHQGTDFSGHWVTLTCDVDSNFTPGVVPLIAEGTRRLPTKPLSSAALNFRGHTIYDPSTFDDFGGGARSYCRLDSEVGRVDVEGGLLGLSLEGGAAVDKRDHFDDLSLATPDLRPLMPSGKAGEVGMQRSISSVKFNEAFDSESSYADDLSSKYSTQIMPERSSSIAFPKIAGPNTPKDTLSAIKGNLYDPKFKKKGQHK